jgi:hypothetical protein
MKMEIPVVADGAGSIAEIHVGEGDSVAEGQAGRDARELNRWRVPRKSTRTSSRKAYSRSSAAPAAASTCSIPACSARIAAPIGSTGLRRAVAGRRVFDDRWCAGKKPMAGDYNVALIDLEEGPRLMSRVVTVRQVRSASAWR